MQIRVANEGRAAKNNVPCKRGWSAGGAFYDEGKHLLAVFGGLTGDDYHPVRMNDLWVCTITTTSTGNQNNPLIIYLY